MKPSGLWLPSHFSRKTSDQQKEYSREEPTWKKLSLKMYALLNVSWDLMSSLLNDPGAIITSEDQMLLF